MNKIIVSGYARESTGDTKPRKHEVNVGLPQNITSYARGDEHYMQLQVRRNGHCLKISLKEGPGVVKFLTAERDKFLKKFKGKKFTVIIKTHRRTPKPRKLLA